MPISTSAPMSPVPVADENIATPPVCEEECVYRIRFENYTSQSNTLQAGLYHLVDEWRCGWNLKEGAVGGQPLDYAPCICPPNDY